MMLSLYLSSTIVMAAILYTPVNAANTLRENNKKLITQEMLQNRIVGGNQAELGEYPYFTQWRSGCAASLIHEDILLSAAHCNQNSGTQVIVGAYEYGVAGNGAVARTIVKRTLHPNFNKNTQSNDYLILKLNSPVTTIQPVTLNRSNSSPVNGEDVVVVGLGRLAEDGMSPQYLQEVTVQAVSQTT